MTSTIWAMLVLFFLANPIYSQTYIPMPSGYTDGRPVMEQGDYIYCVARKGTATVNNSTDVWDVMRISKSSNDVTQLSSFTWQNAYSSENPPMNFVYYNGSIYFRYVYSIYRLDVLSGSVSLFQETTTFPRIYLGFNNKIYYYGTGGILYAKDVNSEEITTFTWSGSSVREPSQFVESEGNLYFVTKLTSNGQTNVFRTNGTSDVLTFQLNLATNVYDSNNTRWVKLNCLIFNIVYWSIKYEFIDILNQC